MRNFIFIGILVGMLGLGVFHAWTGSWTGLTVDGFVALYAWRAWKPRRR